MAGRAGGHQDGQPARRAHAAVASVLAALVGGTAAPAKAYRTVADDLGVDGAVVQAAPTVLVAVDAVGLPGLSSGALLMAAQDAAAAWVLPCSILRFVVSETASGVANDSDGITSIVVITAGWEELGYAPRQAAITEARYARRGDTWIVADADILINGDGFDWTATDAPALTAVLLHELAHVAGVSHPCEFFPIAGEPDCDDEPGLAADAIMFPRYQLDGLAPRADDVAAICTLYPPDPCAAVTCTADEMCVSGACVAARVCDSGEVCTFGECGLGGAHPGACVAPGSTGSPCTIGEECASRLCLTSMRLGSYCTDACSFDRECAAGEACTAVSGTTVCAPAGSGSGGCSARRPRCSVSAPAIAVVACLVGAFARGRLANARRTK